MGSAAAVPAGQALSGRRKKWWPEVAEQGLCARWDSLPPDTPDPDGRSSEARLFLSQESPQITSRDPGEQNAALRKPA